MVISAGKLEERSDIIRQILKQNLPTYDVDEVLKHYEVHLITIQKYNYFRTWLNTGHIDSTDMEWFLSILPPLGVSWNNYSLKKFHSSRL